MLNAVKHPTGFGMPRFATQQLVILMSLRGRILESQICGMLHSEDSVQHDIAKFLYLLNELSTHEYVQNDKPAQSGGVNKMHLPRIAPIDPNLSLTALVSSFYSWLKISLGLALLGSG